MHLPEAFAERNVDVLRRLIAAHPFAAWIVPHADGADANHLPWLHDPLRGEYGTLAGHVARANSVWQRLADAGESLVIFQGPEHYITPSWYPSKHVTGKAVPTWNYAVVHCRGRAVIRDDIDWKRRHLEALTETHESSQALPWKMGDAPSDYLEQMMRGIVGIEIELRSIDGKWKMGQNRIATDRRGVIAGLEALANPRASATAHEMEIRLLPPSVP